MSTVKNARRLHQYLAIPPVHLQVMIYLYWLVVEPTPLKNMSVGMMTFPIYGKIKFMFQPNNQYIDVYIH